MPKFISTSGKTKIAIGICGRCARKVAYSSLRPDPNYPALYVCEDRGCWDDLDPYRLPARQSERIDLDHPRPDVGLVVATMPVPAPEQFDGVTQLNPSHPWQPNTAYHLGNQVTPGIAIGFVAAGETISVYACIASGVSGAAAPVFPAEPGQTVTDGTVTWLNLGPYLP
jgi:hypothetical protein